MVKRLNIPNTVHPNAVHPNTVHPNTTNQDIKSKCSKVVQTKSSWATTISPWRTSLPNLNRTRSPTATSCTASWFVAWNKKTIRSAWNQQVTACFFLPFFPPGILQFLWGYKSQGNWISGWWFQPLWKILVSWDSHSQYMEKSNSCSKALTRYW